MSANGSGVRRAIVAGVDEAGRGPWAGPVVAAVVILRDPVSGLNDSKKLERAMREQLYARIMHRSIVGIGVSSVQEIDSINILAATKLAMRRAYDALEIKPDVALIDGNQYPELPCAMEAIIQGDAICSSIAAASLIAKVTRDRLMNALAERYPGYGWEHNAGYGTAEHQRALQRQGVTAEHRRSFAPIRKLLSEVA